MEIGQGNLEFIAMKAQIISIGNELLIGDTINTNASWMGNYLTECGFEVTQITTISDDVNCIKNTISEAMAASDLVLCTGGLGPTHDDLTKKAVADLFGSQLVLDESVLNFIKERFQKWGIPFSESNYDQAMVPDNCEVLFNNHGSAPGMWFHENNCYLAVMPGVPQEMKFLIRERVHPKIKEIFGEAKSLYSAYLHTAGIGESTLSDEILGDLTSFFNDDISLAFLPAVGGVVLRLNSKGKDQAEAREKLQPLYDAITRKAKNYITGEGKDASLSATVGKLLKQKNMTIATAESCTGGLIMDALTDIPGSSEYVTGGIVAYSNDVKKELLAVSDADLEAKGAVSKEVALQMAKNVAEKLKTDIGISATGIAGPGGGTPDKPVGTVWIGFYSRDNHFAIKTAFAQDRINNKKRTMIVALDIVRRVLSGITEMPYGLKKHLS